MRRIMLNFPGWLERVAFGGFLSVSNFIPENLPFWFQHKPSCTAGDGYAALCVEFLTIPARLDLYFFLLPATRERPILPN
jgi:hypothetical protein